MNQMDYSFSKEIVDMIFGGRTKVARPHSQISAAIHMNPDIPALSNRGW